LILVNIILLSVAAAIAWWLSGYDSQVTGENNKSDLIRRGIRCGLTLFLLVILVSLPYSIVSAPPMFLIVGLLALIWTGCMTELGARCIHRLFDPEDKREFDPNQSARHLDMVASLLKNGRHEEAAQLCATLKESGDANILVLETLLARNGIQFENDRKPKPLTEAYNLRSQGKFDEAEMILNSLLAENPSNVDAALMLMRLYVQDFRRSDKAVEILRALEKQPHIPPGHIEYAQRSIHDWQQKKRAPEAVVLPESVDELIACGYLGTAIEVLERKVKEQPQDFDSWLKLAEAHGLHSGNIQRAEKMVQKIELNGSFSAEQIQIAKDKLKEWREVKPQRN
jgi:thioredoxin-like negative regulator of GroEL